MNQRFPPVGAHWTEQETLGCSTARIAATEGGGSSEIGTGERLRLIASMGALAERLRRQPG